FHSLPRFSLNPRAPTVISTLSLHDALPISCFSGSGAQGMPGDWSSVSRFVRLAFLKKYGVKGKKEEQGIAYMFRLLQSVSFPLRSEEHTSELQSRFDLVCRLLLEKKKKKHV